MTSKKSPNVYKSCPSSLEKLKVLTPFQKLHKNMVDLGKIFVATGFENSSKAQLNRPIWSHWLACVTTTNCHIQPSVGSWALINGSRKRARMRTRLLRFIFPQKSWVENTIIIIIWARKPKFFLQLRVTRWLDYLFNIWLFTTVTIGPKASIFYKRWFKILQNTK